MQSEEAFKRAVGCDVCAYCQKESGIGCKHERGWRPSFGQIRCANCYIEAKVSISKSQIDFLNKKNKQE